MQRRLLAVVSAMAIIAVGCDDGLPDLDTEPTAEAIQSILGTAGVSENLRDCPVDGFETVLSDSFALVDGSMIEAALSGRGYAETFETGASPDEAIACGLVTDAGNAIGFYALEAPTDITSFSNDFSGLASGAITVDVDESRLFRGGRFYWVCAESNDPTVEYCQVNWLDDNVMVGVFALGEDAAEIDTNLLEERYRYTLPTIIDRLTAT